MSAFYLEPGHTFTFGTSATVTLQTNPTIFENNSSSVFVIAGSQYVATATTVIDSPPDQAILCSGAFGIRGILQRVEQADVNDQIENQDLVEANTVTVAGTNIAVSAFGPFATVLPECFFVGVDTPGSLTPGAATLRSDRITAVEASSLWVVLTDLANDYGFAGNTDIFVTIIALGFVFLGGVAAVVLTKSAMFGSNVGALLALGFGMEAPHFLIQWTFVFAILASMGAGAYWLRQVPR